MPFPVSLLSQKEVIFEGQAESVIVPGEEGVFEILPFHKSIISRLLSGIVWIDTQSFRIRRGVVKFSKNRMLMVVEEA